MATALAAGAWLLLAASLAVAAPTPRPSVAAGSSPASTPTPGPSPSNLRLAGQITDETGVLDGETARVRAALDDLYRSEALRLWLVFVHTNNGTLAQEVARQRFVANEFGPNDMVLVVAVDDHRYGWWERTADYSAIGQATAMTSEAVDRIVSGSLDWRFREGQYADGVVDLAGILRTAVRSARYPPSWAPTSSPVDYGSYPYVPQSEDSGGDSLWIFLFIALASIGVFGAVTGGRGSGGDSDGGSWSSSGDSSSSSSSSGHGGGGGWSSSGSSGGHGGGGGWSGGGSSSGGSSGGGHGGGGGW